MRLDALVRAETLFISPLQRRNFLFLFQELFLQGCFSLCNVLKL